MLGMVSCVLSARHGELYAGCVLSAGHGKLCVECRAW